MAAFRLCRTFHLTRGLSWCRFHSGRSQSSRASRHWPSGSISVVVAAVGSGLLAWKNGWFGLPQLNAARVRLVLRESCTTCVTKLALLPDIPQVLGELEMKRLPHYSQEEVSKHKSPETGIWVSYKGGVYDITEFVDSHPGGDKILLAAGRAIDPFWAMYAAHQTEETENLLEEMRIGDLVMENKNKEVDPLDPYGQEPWHDRHPAVEARSQKPYNAEPPLELLTDKFLTPNALFYVRNHLPVPQVSMKDYRLKVKVEGRNSPTELTLEDLKAKFKQYTITAAIQCGGNRRNAMSKVKHVRGLPWGPAAISNAQWTGVRLRDVLAYAGMSEKQDFRHVQFEGLDHDLSGDHYGASIPIDKALSPDGDVLLAFEMNGEPLPLDHGYPLRVVVPGTVGARNVKWLSSITVSTEESPSFWQQNDYKVFSPNVTVESADYKTVRSMQEMPVQSAISEPRDGFSVDASEMVVQVKGYAYSGGGRGVNRVDVSADGGQTWHLATLTDGHSQDCNTAWAWTLWQADLAIPKQHNGQMEIVCRAVDSSLNSQPEGIHSVWNFRGLGNNAWHHVKVNIK